MKRLLILFLAVLLLTGCGTQTSQETTAGTTEATVEETTVPEATGLYEENSTVEQQTKGAVRAYALEGNAYTGLLAMNDRLLLVAADGTLTVLRGEKCEVVATADTDLSAAWSGQELRAGEQGVGYYVEATREVVILDTKLQQIRRIALPEQLQGKPAIHLGQGEIFYCVDSEIRALDIETGISRLVRSHNCVSQELVGSYFDDSILGCRIVDSQGVESIVYLYAQTGQVVISDRSLGYLQTYGQDYFALRYEGTTLQRLFGSGEAQTMQLNVDSENLTAALALGGVVNYGVNEQGLYLEFYDLDSGKRSAQITIRDMGEPEVLLADENYLWILESQKLYRWDVSASAIDEEAVYTTQLYTAKYPDATGLAKSKAKAEQLTEQYGVGIYIWENAANNVEGYALETEYQVDVINDALNRLEQVFAKLPAEVLEKTAKLQVYLVRSIDGEKQCLQYWSGGECHMVITPENVEEAFLQGMGWAVDSRVLGNSRDFDTWDNLNPSGFTYTYDYAKNAQRENPEEYLEGDKRAFIDLESMSYPTEDRSRIFAAAMLEGNAEIFAGDTMQDKLLRLCEGIREAYDLEESTEDFPWEQYLEESIAEEE